MRRGELIASLAATAPACLAKLARAHSNLSALDRCTRAFRVLAVVAVSLVSFAHEAATQEPVHRIGIIVDGVQSPETRDVREIREAFRDGLRARGYEVGRNLQIEVRYNQGQLDRIPALVAELVALRPEIIVGTGTQNAVAVHAAAPTIPLVFLGVANPVGLGLVPNLAHPGGNVTGITMAVPEDFGAKMLQLLKTVAPAASRIAVLVNPTNPIHQREQLKFPDYARRLGVELVTVEATKAEELEAAFEKANTRGPLALMLCADRIPIERLHLEVR